MATTWLSVFVITTIFISAEMASVEIISTPTKVAVTKPKPFAPDAKLGRAKWESNNKMVKVENSTKLLVDNEDVKNTMQKNNRIHIPEKGSEGESMAPTQASYVDNIHYHAIMPGSAALPKCLNLSEVIESEKRIAHPEVNNWPSIFVLQPHPTHPVVCYSGKTLNIHKNNNNDLDISSIKEATANDTKSSARETKKFVLSSDPEYPVMCQEMFIPSLSNINGTAEEENATIVNVTCIRRDYEHGISAIFINKVGPIQSAWNIFNSTIAYGVFNVENADSIGEIRMLNDTIVDCGEYGVVTDDKGLSSGTIASLLGVG